MQNLLVKQIDLTIDPPVRANPYDAGIDLRITEDVLIRYGEVVMVGTGVAVQVPMNHVGIVVPRSSTGKRGVLLANTIGVIDYEYHKEIMLLLTTQHSEGVRLSKNERVAQLLVMPVVTAPIQLVDDLGSDNRGGFGSTGTHEVKSN